MRSECYILVLLTYIVAGDIENTSNTNDLRTVGQDGVNEVVNSGEKYDWKKQVNLHETIKPLAARDVKCLVSLDRYCSSDMKEMKGVLIEAIQRNCEKCTTKQKQKAGRIISSMLIHDTVSWKILLTKYGDAKQSK